MNTEDLFGNLVTGSGTVPTGTIIKGQFANRVADYLPCDGNSYLKSAYPLLDTTGLTTIGDNTLVTRTMPASVVWNQSAGVAGGLTVTVAMVTNQAAVSTDGGTTNTLVTLPAVCTGNIAYGNGTFVAGVWNSAQVMTSTNGTTWTLVTVPWMIDRLTFAFGLFVIFTSQVGVQYCCTSANGAVWINRVFPDLILINAINLNPYYDYGHFSYNSGFLNLPVAWYRKDYNPNTGAAASNGSLNNTVLTTKDCITWERVAGITDIATNATGGTICILSEPLLDDIYAVSFNYNGQSTASQPRISYNRGQILSADLGNNQTASYSPIVIKDGTTPFNVYHVRNFAGMAIALGANTTGKIIAISYDQCKTWTKALSTTLTIPLLQYGSYLAGSGNGRMVTSVIGNRMFFNNSTASAAIATLDVDTTKFRTPIISGAYIKVT
jgi:hypothetical protein